MHTEESQLGTIDANQATRTRRNFLVDARAIVLGYLYTPSFLSGFRRTKNSRNHLASGRQLSPTGEDTFVV